MSEIQTARDERGIVGATIHHNDCRRRYYQCVGSVHQAQRDARIPEMILHCDEVRRLREAAESARSDVLQEGFSKVEDEEDSDLDASSVIEEYRDALQQWESDN